MTREEAIKEIIEEVCIGCYGSDEPKGRCSECGFKIAIADIEKQIRWQKTERYNRMIEAFECDFALIEKGHGMFEELDKKMKDKRYALAEDMGLMQELSYLLRHEKAAIYLRGEKENEEV